MSPDRCFHIRSIRRLFAVLVITFLSLHLSIIGMAQQRTDFLVDKVYDYNNYLRASYFYDNENKLIEILSPEHLGAGYSTEWAASKDEFEYLNGRVSKITHTDISYHMFDYETKVYYDTLGRLIRSEVYRGGNQISFTNYRYENGKMAGISDDPVYTDTIVYDASGNVRKHIYILPETDLAGDPIPGTTRRVVSSYEYDHQLQPNFGLDYLFIFQPLPGMGTETGLARMLSRNNLVENVSSGTTWTYTYNEYGLPATVETNWEGSPTTEPMLLRIKYRQVDGTGVAAVLPNPAMFRIFPNPTKNEFTVDCETPGSIILYNLLGTPLLNRKISGATKIDVRHLPKGLYVLRFFSHGIPAVNRKIVKQ